MRRVDKEVSERAVIESFLTRLPVGRLVTNGSDGYPRIKPLNFVYHQGFIYFHSAASGEKIDDIARDDRVCFEADEPVAFMKAKNQPCEASYLYRSVILKGRAMVVEDPLEREEALKRLMEKYQPERGYDSPFPPEKLAITTVVCIRIEEMTMKEDIGKGPVRETVLEGIAAGRHLPFVVEKE